MCAGMQCILVGACWQSASVKCARHGMGLCYMEAQSHDKGRVEEV